VGAHFPTRHLTCDSVSLLAAWQSLGLAHERRLSRKLVRKEACYGDVESTEAELRGPESRRA